MLVKQSSADFHENILGDGLLKDFNSIFIFFARRNHIFEQIAEIIEREGVHGIDAD